MTLKEIAEDFLQLAAKGDSKKAFQLYTSSKLTHHNAYFAADPETLMLAMEESAKENPERTFEIQRTLVDRNLVATHSFIKQNQEDKGMALVHIFRFEGDKIVEMWDIGQPVPMETINENGMF